MNRRMVGPYYDRCQEDHEATTQLFQRQARVKKNEKPRHRVAGSSQPPRSTCGCQRRKEWLNRHVPGLGTAVEVVTTVTGIKAVVDAITRTPSDDSD